MTAFILAVWMAYGGPITPPVVHFCQPYACAETWR